MKRIAIVAAVALGVVVAAASVAEPVRAAGRWRLDLKPGEFSSVIDNGRAHYYLTYTLGNSTGEARKPVIRFEVRTETKKTHADFFHPGALSAIRKATGSSSLAGTSQVRRTELANDASVEGVAHFGRIDPNADDLEVRVYGLWDPVVRDKKGVTWSERRVLVLKYERSGDEYNRPEDPITLVSRSQVVEGEPKKLHGGDDDD